MALSEAPPTGAHHPTTSRSTRASGPGRGWALAGIAAAVAGIAGIAASMAIDAVYSKKIAGDASAIEDKLATQTAQMLVFHVTTMIAALLLIVVAAGLRRRLAAGLPADSLLPSVAGSGLLLVSVAGLLGTGLDTEFIFGVKEDNQLVPEAAVFFGHWVGTIPWLWVGAGVAALCVAAAALWHRVLPRWIGVVSLILGGIITLLGISPLQYMAGMVGPIWLLVVSIGFAARDRESV